MRRLPLLILVAILWTAAPAAACSLAGSEPFRPTLPEQPRLDPATGSYAAPPPLTLVSVSVSRGTGNDGFTCVDAGTLLITVALPADSPYFIDEIGFYVRTLAGEDITAGHRSPIKALGVDPRSGTLMMHWLDGAPSEQRPLDLDLELSAVTHDLALGPPLRVRVRADVGARAPREPDPWARALAQQLAAYAASDFAATGERVAAVRGVHLRLREGTDDEAPAWMLCGEFRRDQAWAPFATLETDPYEQWLGGQAEALCATAERVEVAGDLTSALQARLAAPRAGDAR